MFDFVKDFAINALRAGYLFIDFVVCRFFFQKNFFRKKYFRNTIRVSNCLDPDQARHYVGPDLGPNYLQKLSADDTSRQSVY